MPRKNPRRSLPSFLEKLASKPQQTEDQYQEANAKHVRTQLAKAYVKMDPVWFCRYSPSQLEEVRSAMARHPWAFVASYFGEDHSYAIMQEWLSAYDRLATLRASRSPM